MAFYQENIAMPHIHTQPGQHDFTASGFIIRTDGPEPKLLLHKHKKIGRYYHFGGHVELHETPWQAIIHELQEESGYLLSQLQLLQPKDRLSSLPNEIIHPQPVAIVTHSIEGDHNHTDIEYAFMTNEEPAHRIDSSDSADFILVSQADIDAGLYDIPEDMVSLCTYVLQQILPNWDVVDPKTYQA